MFLENSIIPNLDVRYDLNPFMNDIHSALSAYLTSPVTDFELLDLSLEVPEIDIEDTIITENLINYLIGSSLSPVKNNNPTNCEISNNRNKKVFLSDRVGLPLWIK